MGIYVVWSAVHIGDITKIKRKRKERKTSKSDPKIVGEAAEERSERGERKVRKVAKFENFILIMNYCRAVVDIAKTNAIAQQNRLLKTIFYQTKFRIQRSIIIKNK